MIPEKKAGCSCAFSQQCNRTPFGVVVLESSAGLVAKMWVLELFLFVLLLNTNILPFYQLVLKIGVKIFMCINPKTVLLAISVQFISTIHRIRSGATSVRII